MSFAVVLFGDGKSYIFNTNCRTIALLSKLRKECSDVCCEDDLLDLVDENGQCKNLFDRLEDYASDFIASRERLILLRVEETTRDDRVEVRYTPLLKRAYDNKDFMAVLNPTKASEKAAASKAGLLVKKKSFLDLNGFIGSVANKAPSSDNIDDSSASSSAPITARSSRRHSKIQQNRN